jgi:hypothetical protein
MTGAQGGSNPMKRKQPRAVEQFERQPKDQRLGDAPVEAAYHGKMEFLAREIDHLFNGDLRGEAREVGFVLMIFPLNDGDGRANYISNASRADVVTMLKEQIVHFESQPGDMK